MEARGEAEARGFPLHMLATTATLQEVSEMRTNAQ
jgi:hypothetical protein